MFGHLNVSCEDECPARIRDICVKDFSHELASIISDAVKIAQDKTIQEIQSYVAHWDPEKEFDEIYCINDGHFWSELKKYGAKRLKDDVILELKCMLGNVRY